MVRTLEHRSNGKIDKKIRQKPRVSYVEDPLVEVEKKPRGRKPKCVDLALPKRKYVRKKPLKTIKQEILTFEEEFLEADDTTTSSIPCESTRESMETEFDPEHDELKQEIMEEYKKVKKRYDQIVLADGYSYFDSTFKLKIPKVEMKIPEVIRYPHNRSFKPATFRDTSSRSYQLSRGSLTYHAPLPIMKYWSHTNINIVGKDECSLSHVPYLGDGEDDPSFTEELLNTYEEGIHGEKAGWGKKINDFILFYTISPILSRHTWHEHSRLLKLMHSVYDLFPNKNSAKEMAQNYADLVARFTPQKSQKTKLFDDLGELKQNFTPAMMQSSNRNLLCKRCYLIDCIIHPTDVTCNDVHIERAEKASDDPKEPCGNFCYRNSMIQKTPNKKSPRKKSNVTLEVTVTSEEPVEWTPHEESVISLLRSANLSSICRLAALLGTICRSPPKTCKQVYDYINGKGPFSPVVDKGDRGEIEKDGSRALVALNHRVFRVVTGGLLNNHKPYVSCNHPGECSAESNCSCRKESRMCNKFCGCPTDCRHRFPGCRCKPGNCRTNQCQCFFASWECDPDMCHSCNCDGTDDKVKPICKNINIQRCLQRKLYIAPSTVAGTGCYADEFIPKGEYIGEYVGEIISQMEAERRGKIYDKFKCSYLFTMNSDQAIDATRVGNIMRFVNHSKHPNCAAKVMIVNGDHRIAFFALADIHPHEELFFDYSYNSNQLKEFVYIEKKRPMNP